MTEKEARKALQLAHALVLNFLDLNNDYFKLGLEDDIQLRLQAFMNIWCRADATGE